MAELCVKPRDGGEAIPLDDLVEDLHVTEVGERTFHLTLTTHGSAAVLATSTSSGSSSERDTVLLRSSGPGGGVEPGDGGRVLRTTGWQEPPDEASVPLPRLLARPGRLNGGPCSPGGGPRLETEHDLGPTIGHGSFGRVLLARHRLSGRVVAVKEMVFHGGDGAQEAERLQRELLLCEQLAHPHIVRYLGHDLAVAAEGGRCLLFLEYCSGGSLSQHLESFGPLRGPLLVKYCRHVLSGLQFLHGLRPPVVHRDLKCANLLLAHDASVKIADFGASKRLRSTTRGRHTLVGSVFWMAPELLRGELSVACDVWSLGCCFIELVTARHAWSEMRWDNLVSACRCIMATDAVPELPSSLSVSARNFVNLCLRRDVSQRASVAELLEHEFVAGG